MKLPFRSLRIRLLLSYLIVVLVGAVTMIVMMQVLAPQFFAAHLAAMTRTFGTMSNAMVDQLETSFNESFGRALTVSLAASIAAALIVSAFASERIVRPVEAVRRAARRLASGAYRERVPVPEEVELAGLAADVNALAEALDEVEQRRLRLIAEVAHELRTPLSTIEGYMEGLLDGVFEPSDEIFAAAGHEAARLKRLAHDLSALSRAEEGRMALHLDVADLGNIAAMVAERLRPQFEANGVDLVVHQMPELPVQVDRDRMAQVFTNIIGNALTYTPSGGKVAIMGATEDGMASISVVDTGIGIAPNQLDAVFERFYRGDTSRPGGTGIGLTIARSIVRLHAGEVTAFSEGPDRGARFEVSVPLA